MCVTDDCGDGSDWLREREGREGGREEERVMSSAKGVASTHEQWHVQEGRR